MMTPIIDKSSFIDNFDTINQIAVNCSTATIEDILHESFLHKFILIAFGLIWHCAN